MQAGEFTPACSGPGRGHDEHRTRWVVAPGGLVGDLQNLVGLGPDPLDGSVGMGSSATPWLDRVVGDQPFGGCIGHDLRPGGVLPSAVDGPKRRRGIGRQAFRFP